MMYETRRGEIQDEEKALVGATKYFVDKLNNVCFFFSYGN